MSETNVEPTNYLEMVEQLRHDRDKYIGMWRSQCTIAEEVMQERDRLTEKLEEAIEEAKVWQDRYRKRGYVMDEHAKALERAEVAEAELARYKQGVEVETIVHSNGSSWAGFDAYVHVQVPLAWSQQRVRVLVMKVEDKNE